TPKGMWPRRRVSGGDEEVRLLACGAGGDGRAGFGFEGSTSNGRLLTRRTAGGGALPTLVSVRRGLRWQQDPLRRRIYGHETHHDERAVRHGEACACYRDEPRANTRSRGQAQRGRADGPSDRTQR